MHNYTLPLEYHAEWKNDHLMRQTVCEGILISGTIALTVIFPLLQSASESWRMAFAALFTLLAMMTGGILTAFSTILALFSLVIFGNNPGYEISRPISMVILGGLVTTMGSEF